MTRRQRIRAGLLIRNRVVLAAGLLLASGLSGCDCEQEDQNEPTCGLTFVYPTEGMELDTDVDQDAQREGLQVHVQLSVSVCSISGTISLQVADDPGSLRTMTVNGISTYAFPDYTLPEGSITLSAVLRDSLGTSKATAEIDIDVQPVEPPVYSLEFEQPAQDDLVLGGQDDVDGDLRNGLQFDVVVGSSNLPTGTRVDLWVAGRSVPPAGIDADGRAVFVATTLPESRTSPLQLVATAEVADRLLTARRSLYVDTGSCEVVVEPEPNLAGCDFTDPAGDLKPSVPGYQTQLTVMTECSDVALTVGEISQSASTAEGQVSFLVTLVEGANLVSVIVSDAQTERVGMLDGLVYHVDTIPPEVEVVYPDGSTPITRLEDRDETLDGIQVIVQGTCSDSSLDLIADALPVTVSIDGTERATVDTDGSGAFLVPGISFLDSGNYTMVVACGDYCGTQGSSGPIPLTVVLEPPRLEIVSPEDGAVLLADGDLEPLEPEYQTLFAVETTYISADTEVRIECRRPNLYRYRVVGSALRGDGSPFEVPVSLAEGESLCRAAAQEGTLPVLSDEIRVVVSSYFPWVTIVEPEDGAFLSEGTTALSAFIDPAAVEVRICLNEDPCDPVTDPQVFTQNGIYIPFVPLEPGLNTITVQVFDQIGSMGSDSVSVTYDSTPPVLTFIDPAGDTATLEQTDLYDDYFYDVVVQVDEQPLQDEICLSVNHLAERCVTAAPEAGVWRATFTASFLLPGDNDLDARARDLAENEGTGHQDLTVNSTLPRLEVLTGYTVDGDGHTVEEYTPLDGQIIGWEGRIDVLVVTEDVPEGAQVELVVNGSPGTPLAPDEDGDVLFPSVPVLDETDATLESQGGWNTLQARVVGSTGQSALIRVRRDTTPPTIDLVDLSDGMYISPGNGFPDVDPIHGYQVDITAATGGVEDGQLATLGVDCTGNEHDADYTAEVHDDQAGFRVESLPDEGSCTLVATVSDRAGLPAVPSTREVLVDWIGPVVVFLRPLDEEHIDFQNDEVPSQEGIQYDISVQVTGGTGDLHLFDPGETFLDETAPIPSQAASTILFDNVTLPDGELVLAAAASDPAGNETVESVRITVQSEGVSLDFFALEEGSLLNTATDLDGIEPGWQGDIEVVVNASYPGQTILLCLYDPEGTGIPGEPQCSGEGWITLDRSALNASGLSGTFFDVTLLDGRPTIMAEMPLGDTQVFTPAIGIVVDTVRPTILSWTLNNDSVAWVTMGGVPTCAAGTDNLLNLTEAPTRLADVTLAFDGLSGNRRISIYDLGDRLVSSGTTTGDLYSFTATLSEQGHQLRAVVSDIHNNPLASSAPMLSMAIDITPPTLVWSYPTNGMILLADADSDGDPANDLQTQVLLHTDTNPGIPAHITYQGGHLDNSPTTVGDGTPAIQIVTTIPQGAPIPLDAATWDTACNQRTASISLPIVDVQPPTITILPPEEVDYEMDLEVVTTYAESGQEIRVLADGLGLIGAGDIGQVPSPGEPVTTLIPIYLPGGTWMIHAVVQDISGNEATSEPLVLPELPIRGCGLIFLDPTGNPIYINADGYTGTGIEPKIVSVTLFSSDIYCRGQVASLRLGCALDAEDIACDLVLTAVINDNDLAEFEVPFYHGDQTTMHGRAQNPVTMVVGTTDQKTVLVDLVPPQVTIDAPIAGSQLGRRLAMGSAEWSVEGTSMVGPVLFTTSGAVDGSFSLQYHGGPVLSDSSGPILGRDISFDGTHTLSDVRFPTADEQEVLCQGSTEPALGVCFEVAVQDLVGNTALAAIPLDVDADSPARPLFSTVNRDPTIQRSGRVAFEWTAVTDDAGGGGLADRYEIRLAQDPPPSGWLGNLPADIVTWETQVELVATVAGTADLSHILGSLGFDSTWHVGIRAFDEIDNWSQGTEIEPVISTRLVRQVIGTISGCGADWDNFTAIGDVNGDGLDDLLLSCAGDGYSAPGKVLVLLGEVDPANPVLSPNPVLLDPPGIPEFFGSSSAGVGDVDGDGLDDFLVSNQFDNAVHLYFGSDGDIQTDLAVSDITIYGPFSESNVYKYTETAFSRSGHGNFADIGSGALPYDDLFFITVYQDGSGTFLNYTVFVVLGRSPAAWGTIEGEMTIDDSDPLANCQTNRALTIIADPSASGFGLHGGMTTLSDDAWGDLVVSTDYLGSPTKEITQYVYYGGSLTACPSTAWTLGDADQVLVSTGQSSRYHFPDIVVRRPVPGEPAGEYAVGLWLDDWINVFQYRAGEGLGLLEGIHWSLGEQRFGFSPSFAGNLDQDALQQDDLAVGASASQGYTEGGLWVVLGGENLDNRFEDPTILSLDLESPSATMGWTVVSGFDYNGDSFPDIAMTDPTAETVILLY